MSDELGDDTIYCRACEFEEVECEGDVCDDCAEELGSEE